MYNTKETSKRKTETEAYIESKREGEESEYREISYDSEKCREITRQKHSKNIEILTVNKKELSFCSVRGI